MKVYKSNRRIKFEEDTFPHLKAICRTALWLTLHQRDAETLLVSTMEHAYRSGCDFSHFIVCRLELFRILVREFSRLRAHQHRSGQYLKENLTYMSVDNGEKKGFTDDSFDDYKLFLLTGIPQMFVKGAVARLRPLSRLVLILLVREKFTYEEISFITDLRVASVQLIVRRVRRFLPRYLIQQQLGAVSA